MQRLGETWLVPATGTVQWHFFPCSCFQPYVGVGLNYSFFVNTKSSLPGIDIGLSNYFGPAFQVGFDYMLTCRWLFNFDVKYVPARTDAQLVGAINETIRIKLDPVVFGLGVGYVF